MLEHDSEWQKAHPDFPPHMVSHMAEHDDCEDRKELCAISLTALLCLFPRSCRGQIVMKLCLISCLDKETGVSFGSECAWHWVSDWARWGLGLKPKGLSSGSDKNTGQGRSEICTVLLTSCVGGRYNMPPPPAIWPLTCWPWKWCPITCDVGYLCANFILPRPHCCRLRPDVRVRQTSECCPCPIGAGHNKYNWHKKGNNLKRDTRLL